MIGSWQVLKVNLKKLANNPALNKLANQISSSPNPICLNQALPKLHQYFVPKLLTSQCDQETETIYQTLHALQEVIDDQALQDKENLEQEMLQRAGRRLLFARQLQRRWALIAAADETEYDLHMDNTVTINRIGKGHTRRHVMHLLDLRLGVLSQLLVAYEAAGWETHGLIAKQANARGSLLHVLQNPSHISYRQRLA